jgi:hypothetical protein
MKAVVLMRIALYGTVLLLAGGVYALRTSSASSHRASGTDLSGRTGEDLPVRVATDGRSVVYVHVRFEMSCADGVDRGPSGFGFSEDYGDRFLRRGRHFDVSGFSQQQLEDGWSVRYGGAVAGNLTADGGAAAGTAWAHETWYRNGRYMVGCDSRNVTWSAKRGMPDAG